MSVNVRMWGKALRRMPRPTKQEWDALDIVSRWLIATRSAVLLMTFLAVSMSGVLAWKELRGHVSVGLWIVLCLGLLMAHATNNLLNDLTDYVKGVDKDNYFRTQYGPQPLAQGFLSIRQLLKYVAFTGAIALAAGVYFVWLRGTPALFLLGVGAVFVLFYTWPLKYIGLGEIAVVVVWGPLMVGGGYMMLTGKWSWDVSVASFAYALGPTCVLFGKHIDKLEADKGKRIRTLPVLLGERLSRAVVLSMMAAQYALVVYLVVIRFASPILLIAFLALPTAWKVLPMFRQPRPSEPPPQFPNGVWPLWYVAGAFLHSARFGMWLLLGLCADALWTVLG